MVRKAPSSSTVFLVDEDSLARYPVLETLRHAGLLAFGFQTPIEALKAVEPLRPNVVVVLDRSSDGSTGREALRMFRRNLPAFELVVVTRCSDIDVVVGYMERGAFKVLPEGTRTERIVLVAGEALERNRKRALEVPLSSEGRPASRLDAWESVRQAARTWKLTSRQTEVLRFVLQKASNKEISRRLGISEGTVERHLTHIFLRACVRGRPALAARVSSLRAAALARSDLADSLDATGWMTG
jgi:DNA-binding NarL/FixJ family response regulator